MGFHALKGRGTVPRSFKVLKQLTKIKTGEALGRAISACSVPGYHLYKSHASLSESTM
ncbi:hypothetical protein QY97_01270 [Bacillus thermotolerans]|nr:hypothetical protein QY97_01270 [Bacillus thermotolerans]